MGVLFFELAEQKSREGANLLLALLTLYLVELDWGLAPIRGFVDGSGLWSETNLVKSKKFLLPVSRVENRVIARAREQIEISQTGCRKLCWTAG